MVAGDVGDQLQLARPEAGQAAAEDQVITVLVVLVVVDQVADVLQAGGRFQQRLGRGVQVELVDELGEDQPGQAGHLPAVRQVDAAVGGEPLDGRLAVVRVVAGVAQRGVDHRQQQAVAHAAVVDLQHVDLEPPHQAIDDRQAGHDDVGPIGTQARHGAAGLGRHLAQPIEQVPHVGVRDLVAAQRQVGLAAAGADHFGQAGERAAGADQQVRREDGLARVLAKRLVDQPHEVGKAFAGQVAARPARPSARRPAAWSRPAR